MLVILGYGNFCKCNMRPPFRFIRWHVHKTFFNYVSFFIYFMIIFLTYVNLCLWFYMHQYVSERRFVCTLASFFANMDGRISTIVPSHALVDLGVFFFPSQKYPCAWNFFPSSSSTGQKHRGGTRVIYFVRGEGSDFGSCFLWGKGFPFFFASLFPVLWLLFPPEALNERVKGSRIVENRTSFVCAMINAAGTCSATGTVTLHCLECAGNTRNGLEWFTPNEK